MQPKSLRVDKAVVTNYHVEQCNTGLLTRDPVCLSRHDLAAMLALISHYVQRPAKGVPPTRECCQQLEKVRDLVTLSHFVGLGCDPGTKNLRDIADTTTLLCAPVADRFTCAPRPLPTLLASVKREELQFINIRLRQIAERVTGIEDERAELSDHGIIEC